MRKPVPVFVYGTLLEGFENHRLYVKPYVHKAVPARIEGELYHLPQGYPGVLPGDGEVIGAALFFSPDEYETVMVGLDELETYFGPGDPRNEYERVEVRARLDGADEEQMVYVYRYLDEEYVRRMGVRVEDGDWRSYMLGKRTE
ncbi:gamma-glutamylcyclotransferase [Brevibacillus brevis]|uniref:Gamma-glutamylcyclotransferase n=1 Tax=Brevibacillus brevis TaxID=1393 RepID=A0ABY9SZF6_BREBE|nr:gamma-glutamylcyclotransferase [Brevibacillus brevis]WNC13209.1 gamma-glutamylcyclotransferase [Brevibacillus brevis]